MLRLYRRDVVVYQKRRVQLINHTSIIIHKRSLHERTTVALIQRILADTLPGTYHEFCYNLTVVDGSVRMIERSEGCLRCVVLDIMYGESERIITDTSDVLLTRTGLVGELSSKVQISIRYGLRVRLFYYYIDNERVVYRIT